MVFLRSQRGDSAKCLYIRDIVTLLLFNQVIHIHDLYTKPIPRFHKEVHVTLLFHVYLFVFFRNRPTGYESVTLIVALRYTVGYIVNVNRNYPFSPIGTLA